MLGAIVTPSPGHSSPQQKQNWFSVQDKEGCGLMNGDIIRAALMSDGQPNG